MLTHGRRGTGLVDLLVALTILGLVGTLATRQVLRSAQWSEQQLLRAERAAQLDAARDVTEALLAASAPTDLLRASDTAAVWWATIGHGPICATSLTGVVVPAVPRTDGVPLSSFSTSPQPGDLLVWHDEGPGPGAADDRWNSNAILSAALIPDACTGSPLLHPVADRGLPAWVLQLAATPVPSVPGTASRVLRPHRLALYHSTPDWALGMEEQAPRGGWTGIQPFAGPLDSPRNGGLQLVWLDSSRMPTSGPPAAVRIMVRAPTSRGLRALGGAVSTDSATRFLRLRNAR